MARPFPWKCRTCGEQAVKAVVVDYSAELQHDGRSYPVTVQTEILECESCKTRVLTDAAHLALADALRAAASLLSPAEIRRQREALFLDEKPLTQKQLAAYIKVSETTVSRWETGGQIQQRAMDLLLRGFFTVPEQREYYAELAGLPVPISRVMQTGNITVTFAIARPAEGGFLTLPLSYSPVAEITEPATGRELTFVPH